MLARRMINQRLKGFVQVVDASPYTAFSPNNGNNWYAGSAAGAGGWFTGAYGDRYLLMSNTTNTDLAASVNAGYTWDYYDSVLPVEQMVLAFGGGVFVGVANTAGSTTAAYSTNNGQTWSSATLPSEQSWSSVTYGDGVFVAVSSGGTAAAYSTDGGQTWTTSTLPFAGSGSNFVCYGAGTFVASANNNGKSDSNIAAYSTDGGQTWTNSPSPTTDVRVWGPVTFGDGLFMLGGYGGCYTSTNGDGWEEVNGGIIGGQQEYIANIIYVDPDS